MFAYIDAIFSENSSAAINSSVDFLRLYSPDISGNISDAVNYRPKIGISYAGGIAKVVFTLLGAGDAVMDIDNVVAKAYSSSSNFEKVDFVVELKRSSELPYVFYASVDASFDSGSVVVFEVEFIDKLTGVRRTFKTVASAV